MVWFTGVEQDTVCVPSGRHRAHLTRGIKTKQERAEESSGGGGGCLHSLAQTMFTGEL
jgi:hypothetical protein